MVSFVCRRVARERPCSHPGRGCGFGATWELFWSTVDGTCRWLGGVWKEEARQNLRFSGFRNLLGARGVREVRCFGMGESCRPFGPHEI